MIGARAVNHIGIAVESLDEQIEYYRDILGAEFEGIEEVPDQRVRVAFFALGSDDEKVRLELLEPTSPDSPVSAFIEKRGPGIHHIAYTVDDLQGRLDALKESGRRLIDETPRRGAHRQDIAFLHPRSSCGVLTELCQQAADL